jgi:hypothetical protein|tara:strand:- start:57 stop:275 length:219 start_codon:yes stop_codon:yes gene_type:complete
MIWGSRDREDYRAFMIEKLTQKGFDELLLDSNTIKKWKKDELKQLRQELRNKVKYLETDRCYKLHTHERDDS